MQSHLKVADGLVEAVHLRQQVAEEEIQVWVVGLVLLDFQEGVEGFLAFVHLAVFSGKVIEMVVVERLQLVGFVEVFDGF